MELGDQTEQALLALLAELARAGYQFVTVTPETHRRVIARRGIAIARDLRDVLGWSLPFSPETLPPRIFELLDAAGAVACDGAVFRSRLRVSSLGGHLFLHSAFPTDDRDSVFFGPDSYRFADFLGDELAECAAARRLVDLGCGTGVGAIIAASRLPLAHSVATDINPLALRLARINAAHAGARVEFVQAASIDEVEGPIDLVIANPPYIADDAGRSYRDGGGMHGARLSLDWALAAARRIEPGGRMLLYTGSAIIGGRDLLRDALHDQLPGLDCALRYRELDPDVFGEEIERSFYRDVDRIAVIGAAIEKR